MFIKLWNQLTKLKNPLSVLRQFFPTEMPLKMMKNILISMLFSINWSNFIVWLPLFLGILGNMCIAIVCCPLTVYKFELHLSSLNKPFFYITKKSGKNPNISRTKKLFNMKLEAYFIIFKGHHLSK